MLLVKLASKDEKALETAVKTMKIGNNIKAESSETDEIQVIGPVNATLYKANDIYNKVIYIKAVSYELLTKYKDVIEAYAKDNVNFKKISIQFDFNPMNM